MSPDVAAIRIVIGSNIRYRRLLAGLSQKAVATRLGVSFQQVQKYERGLNAISCDAIFMLAHLFGCTVDELYDGAAPEALHDSAHPWNPHRVLPLLASFDRIRSPELRERICALVKALADQTESMVEPTL